MSKTITDFIDYSYSNLVWFSFNFVLVVMPLICIAVLNPKAGNLDVPGAHMSQICLLPVLCGVNLAQFFVRPRIYKVEKKT